VRGGDGADDGQPEPVPVGMADPLAAEPLERLEQPVQLDHRTGVGHREVCPSRDRRRGDLDLAARDVVP